MVAEEEEEYRWEFKHSVQADAERQRAWEFWSHVENWTVDPGIESVELSGPFEAGTEGTTRGTDGDVWSWKLVDVQPGESAKIEMELHGARARFEWRFEDSDRGRTRITQRILLVGDGARDYVERLGTQFRLGVLEGMQRLARAIARAAARRKR